MGERREEKGGMGREGGVNGEEKREWGDTFLCVTCYLQ